MKRKKPKEPLPDKDKGLEKYIVSRIKFMREVKKRKETTKKQKSILKHCILDLKFILFTWRKTK